MLFPRSARHLLLALAILVLPSTAFAAKPLSAPVALPTKSVTSVVLGKNWIESLPCSTGQGGPGSMSLNFVLPPDEFFTRVDLAPCSDCASANTLRYTKVHMVLHFPVPCTLPISVATVGAIGTVCPAPNVADIRCQPESFEVSASDSASTIEFILTLPEVCQTTGPAFLRIRFPANGAQCVEYARHPQLVLLRTEQCRACLSYNDVDQLEEDPEPLEDMCAPPPDGIGNPVMYVEVDQCLDTILPAMIADLQADSVSASSIRMTFTAPGDDAYTGRADHYELRRATFPLDADNFTTGDSVANVIAPDSAGTPQRFVMDGLLDFQLYNFAIRAIDEFGNPGPISNVVSVTTGAAPGRVVDLLPIEVTENFMTLRWRAPFSTAPEGEAESYILRGATQPINVSTFDSAPLSHEVPATVGPGEIETYRFEGLDSAQRYWFALRARDHQGNLSPLSNVPTRTTLVGGPLVGHLGMGLGVRVTPTRAPVELFWQSASEAGGEEQIIRIFDMNGRWIRNFHLGTRFGGVTTWDGRDVRGNEVPSGLYFARLIAGDRRVDARIVLVR